MKREDLEKVGFVFDEESQSCTKEVNGNTVCCIENKGTGSWTCQIGPNGVAQNTRISTIDKLNDFIENTCPKNPITIAISKIPYEHYNNSQEIDISQIDELL